MWILTEFINMIWPRPAIRHPVGDQCIQRVLDQLMLMAR